MATSQLTASSICTRNLSSFQFQGFRVATPLSNNVIRIGTTTSLTHSSFPSLVVKAATLVAPKHTTVKPIGDRVLVRIKDAEEKTEGGIILPEAAQTKPQGGELVAIGEGKTVGNNKVDVSVKAGAKVVYSKYAGTEVAFNGSKHLILKDDDIIGILETDEVKDLKPLNDSIDKGVAEAEEKTSGGLLLTEATKEKPSIGTVIAVGPGPLDKEEGNRIPLSITPGNTVLYSKYAGNDFKGKDGSQYIVLKAPDVMAILS